MLCRSFVRQAREVLSHYPQIKHELSIDYDEDHCILDIPEESDGGFPVTVEVDPDELAAQALGLVRDLLSPAMRIRERLAGGEAYKWAFESYLDGKWVTEEWVGFFFWNYFGK